MKQQNSKAEKNKINFIIPDFLNVDECTYLLSTFREHPELYKDNINISGFCGEFVGCKLNKNKKFDRYKLNLEIIESLKKRYNDELKVSMIIMFDKEDINYMDLEDEYCNEIMKIFDNVLNYILCKSAKLREYIREKYKNIKIINNHEVAENNSDFVIMDYETYSNGRFKDKDNSKIILFTDGGNLPNKNWLFKHSIRDSKLNVINPKKDKYYSKNSGNSFFNMKKRNYMNYVQIKEFAELGVNTFILSGLGVYNVAMIENIVDFLYKEEYKMDARIILYRKLLGLKEQKQNAIFQYRL